VEGATMTIEFSRTPMGRRFFEATVPELVKQIARVADALEALLAQQASRDLAKRGPPRSTE
jgi:hypothetical protein